MEKLILFLIVLECFLACLLYKRLRGKLYFVQFLPLILAAAQAGYSAYKGHQQKKKAKKLRETNFTPAALEESLAGSRMAASASGPGYNRGKAQLGQSTSNAINALRRTGGSAGAIQQAVADADARQKEGVKDLEVSDQQFKNQNRQMLTQQLGQKAGYQKESFDSMNAAKSALKGAAEQNQYNAVTGLLSGVAATAAGGGFGKRGVTAMGGGQGRGVQGIAGYQGDLSKLTPEQLKLLYQKMQIREQMGSSMYTPQGFSSVLVDKLIYGRHR